MLNVLISRMAAYCFFDMYEVTDSEKLEQYRSGVLATVKRYGGKYVQLGESAIL